MDYARPEKGLVERPYGVDLLPDEWARKLGYFEFEQPVMGILENVSLLGPALVGLLDGQVVLDTAYVGRLDYYERNFAYFQWAMECRGIPAIELDCAVSLITCHASNYYHWTLEILPKLEAVQEYERQTGEKPSLLVIGDMPGFMAESLEYFDYPVIHNDNYNYQVKKLIVPTTRRHKGYTARSAIEFLRRFRQAGKSEADKLYISRRQAVHRRVTNEYELKFWLADQKFWTLEPEAYTLKGQRLAFSNCKELVAPHGAGMVNMVYADYPKVVELVTPEYTNPCIWLIAAAMGWKYGFVMCDPEPDENMHVDLEKLGEVYGQLV